MIRAFREGHRRQAAATALGAWGDDAADAVPTLEAALASPFAVTRLAALRALLRIDGETAALLDHLETALASPEPYVRYTAVEMLRPSEDHVPRAWEALRRALHDIPEVSGQAMEAFTWEGSIDAEVFEVALDQIEQSTSARYQAREVLDVVDEEEASWVRPFRARLLALLDRDDEDAVAAMGVLCSSLQEVAAVRPALLRWLGSGDVRLRRAACARLAEVGGPAEDFEAPLLRAFQAETRTGKRVDCVVALLRLDPVGPHSLEAVRELLQSPDLDGWRADALGEALGALGARACPIAHDLLEEIEREGAQDPDRARRNRRLLYEMPQCLEAEAARLARWARSDAPFLRRTAEYLQDAIEDMHAEAEDAEDED